MEAYYTTVGRVLLVGIVNHPPMDEGRKCPKARISTWSRVRFETMRSGGGLRVVNGSR